MTHESKENTEPWVQANTAKYAYAYEPKTGDAPTLGYRCGVRFIPYAVLVDPTGTVVFSGSPRDLTDATIEKATQGALTKPLWEQSSRFAKLREALAKDALGDAIREARGLKDQEPDAAIVEAALARQPAIKMAFAERLGKEGNWRGARLHYETLVRSLAGLPEETTARRELEAIAADPSRQKAIAQILQLEEIIHRFMSPTSKPAT